ncbi:hypothetical protein F5Y09DRAFT_15205 [Xylaria sp. FL1042]|nr:hypothetical protein F5Y09DRAFT_15205 [Xylaria sp. FL1042]
MSSLESTEKAPQDGKHEVKESVPNPPPAALGTSAPQECFLDGYEHQYELLIGVEHTVPRPRRMWDGPTALATQYICDECWRRLGHPVLEKA